MAGFRNVAAWATAQDSGKYHVTTFRKAVASATTVANDFIDYTYFAGNPPANFYASAPLEAAYVEGIRGIHVPNVSPSKQFVKSLTVMSAASSATATTNQNQRMVLCDYLLYYPFVDTDAVGEQQDMIQTVTLPRYNTSATFSENKITNGGFDDSTGWTFSQPTSGSVSIAGGVAIINSLDGSYAAILKSWAPTPGKKYRISIDVLDASGATGFSIAFGGQQTNFINTIGTTVTTLTAVTAATLEIKRGGVTNVTIDNLIIEEILATGQGGQIMCVAQSASSAVGTFTVRYTNQDGVSGRTSQSTFTKVVSGGGTLVSSTNGAVTGSQPFVQLQAGDIEATSIESCTFTVAGGGLMALVIVKPLMHTLSTQECRRTTTGNLESYGAATQRESIIHQQPVEIKSGAVLGLVSLGNAGSLASSILTGVLETQWS